MQDYRAELRCSAKACCARNVDDDFVRESSLGRMLAIWCRFIVDVQILSKPTGELKTFLASLVGPYEKYLNWLFLGGLRTKNRGRSMHDLLQAFPQDWKRMCYSLVLKLGESMSFRGPKAFEEDATPWEGMVVVQSCSEQ